MPGSLGLAALAWRSGLYRRAGHGVAASEPAAKIGIGAMLRAERPELRRLRLAADGAFEALGRSLPGLARSLPLARAHSVSTSALESQRWLTGKPSPWSRLTTSVRGSPTTLV